MFWVVWWGGGGGEWESGGGRGGLVYPAAGAKADCLALDATDKLQKASQSEVKQHVTPTPWPKVFRPEFDRSHRCMSLPCRA